MAQKEYSRAFGNFRGIDVTSEPGQVADNRFSYAENMYKDYETGQGVAVETFPGTRKLADFGATINGIYIYRVVKDNDAKDDELYDDKLYIVVHAGKKLYRFEHKNRDKIDVGSSEIFSGMANARSQGYIFNNRLYIIDGEHYVVVDENGEAGEITGDNAYVPTTYSNDEQYEQRNMLTNRFIERQYIDTMTINKLSNSSSDSYKDQSDKENGIICGIYDTYYGNKLLHYAKSMTVHPTFSNVIIDFDKLYNSYYDNFKIYGTSTAADGKYRLNTVKMYDTVNTIEGSFDGCANLTSLTLSNNINKLDNKFFAGTGLSTIHLPAGLEKLGEDAFVGCSNLTKIYCSDRMYEELTKYDEKGFSGDKYGLIREIVSDETTETEELEVIAEDETTTDQGETQGRVTYRVKLAGDEIGSSEIKIMKYSDNIMTGIPAEKITPSTSRIYIHTPCESIEKICIGNVEISDGAKISYIPIRQYINGKIYIIAVDFYNSAEEIINDYIYVYGKASPSKFSTNDKYIALLKNEEGPLGEEDKSIFGNSPDYNGTAEAAIKRCNVACVYDDRIFFTGNATLPNTVFYTQRDLTGHNNPTYIGILNYFNDGVGNTPNIAMMANSTMLMVLKGNTLQDGSIYYHTSADGGNDLTPRIYPSTEGLSGLGCVGMAVNFRDDCVFMSNRGLEAVAKQTVNLERTVEHRSTNIDALFRGKDLTKARAAEWCGYLCILIDGDLYLADSRQMYQGIGGAIEYEWYYISGIGDYKDDNVKYYTESYSRELPKDIYIYPDRVAVDYNSVYGPEGMQYVEIDGTKYFVASNAYKTEDDEEETEWENGTFNKATEILCVDDVLYFGTESGGILCLNSDKRGEDGKIPENTYNRCGHAYTSLLALKLDNAGVPYFTKNTVKRSPTFNLKPFINSAIKIEVATDRVPLELIAEQYSNNMLDFNEFDFSNLAFQNSNRSIFVIKERTKKWTEKQYVISSDRHNSPFGIYELSYRYEIAGRIKK